MYITWQIVFSADLHFHLFAALFAVGVFKEAKKPTLFVLHAVKTIKITTRINLQTLEHALSCRGLTQPFPLPKQFYC